MKRNDSLLHICKKNKREIAGWRRHKETGGHDFLLYRRDRAKIFALTGSDLQNSLLFFADSLADNLGMDRFIDFLCGAILTFGCLTFVVGMGVILSSLWSQLQ